MIIQTNLYTVLLHEEREARKEKWVRQAPFLWIAGLVFILLFAAITHYAGLRHKVQATRKQSTELAVQSASIQKDLQSADLRILAQRSKVSKRDAVIRLARNRMNWAPLLEAIYATTPAQIELTSFQGLCMSQLECVLRISGRIATKDARLDCDKFRLQLAQVLGEIGITTQGKFNRLEEAGPLPRMEGTAYPATEFTIEFDWNNQPDAN